jgi:hypothetical protein
MAKMDAPCRLRSSSFLPTKSTTTPAACVFWDGLWVRARTVISCRVATKERTDDDEDDDDDDDDDVRDVAREALLLEARRSRHHTPSNSAGSTPFACDVMMPAGLNLVCLIRGARRTQQTHTDGRISSPGAAALRHVRGQRESSESRARSNMARPPPMDTQQQRLCLAATPSIDPHRIATPHVFRKTGTSIVIGSRVLAARPVVGC